MHQHITQNSIATHKNITNVQAAAQKIVINNGRHMKLIFMLDEGTLHLPKRPDKAFVLYDICLNLVAKISRTWCGPPGFTADKLV